MALTVGAGTHVRVTRSLIALVAVLAISQATTPTASAGDPLLVAELEGGPIAATSVGDHYCHDFDYPVIRCFWTEDALEQAVSSRLATTVGDTVTVLAVSYVRVFEFASYAGHSAYLSQDYAVLGDIGWNDRISSYWALNSETGAFYTDTVYSGTIDYFCCNQSVGSLSSTFDNRISSVKRT